MANYFENLFILPWTIRKSFTKWNDFHTNHIWNGQPLGWHTERKREREKERKTMMKTQNQYSCNCFLIQCSLRIFYLFITVGHGLKEWREFIWMNCNHHETVENEKKEHGILTPEKNLNQMNRNKNWYINVNFQCCKFL